jgi:hypothetical protein
MLADVLVRPSIHTFKKIGVRVSERYYRLFSIHEIAESTLLKWFFGAMLLFFFMTFDRWINSHLTTVQTADLGRAVCWPYFQSCYKLYFLDLLPHAYSQTTFYMCLYGIMLLIVYLMWRGKWGGAHALTLLLFLWKTFVIFGLTYLLAGPYDYYHLMLVAILLFIPLKEYFLKLTFAFLYFMSVTVKFDPTWILGTYFTSLKLGLPVFPQALTIVLTNLVIFMQVAGCWFLLSKRRVLQRLALTYFTIFHLYSGTLVHYLYPTISLPPLLILFGPMYRHQRPPVSKKSIAGWIVIALIAAFQVLGFVIPTERRLTLEGNRYGMFMFEANHQCVATVTRYIEGTEGTAGTFTPNGNGSCQGFYCLTRSEVTHKNGQTIIQDRYESPYAWNRCDPYEWWSRLHLQCSLYPSVKSVAFTFDHSINGGPFFRIVNVDNICNVSYSPFGHNDWILTSSQAPIVGYPVQNVYD